jgi:adenine deaminase
MNRAATWNRQPLAELTRSLTAVCMGREAADLVITGGQLVNVHTRQVLDDVDGVTFALVSPLVA